MIELNKDREAKVLRDTITDQYTGKKRIPYARVPVIMKPEFYAQNYAKKVIAERYGTELSDEEKSSLEAETFADFIAGYNYCVKYSDIIKNGI